MSFLKYLLLYIFKIITIIITVEISQFSFSSVVQCSISSELQMISLYTATLVTTGGSGYAHTTLEYLGCTTEIPKIFQMAHIWEI